MAGLSGIRFDEGGRDFKVGVGVGVAVRVRVRVRDDIPEDGIFWYWTCRGGSLRLGFKEF